MRFTYRFFDDDTGQEINFQGITFSGIKTFKGKFDDDRILKYSNDSFNTFMKEVDKLRDGHSFFYHMTEEDEKESFLSGKTDIKKLKQGISATRLDKALVKFGKFTKIPYTYISLRDTGKIHYPIGITLDKYSCTQNLESQCKTGYGRLLLVREFFSDIDIPIMISGPHNGVGLNPCKVIKEYLEDLEISSCPNPDKHDVIVFCSFRKENSFLFNDIKLSNKYNYLPYHFIQAEFVPKEFPDKFKHYRPNQLVDGSLSLELWKVIKDIILGFKISSEKDYRNLLREIIKETVPECEKNYCTFKSDLF